MGAAPKILVEDFDEVFSNIAKLYDHAEDILKVAYHESVVDKEEFAVEVEALVSQIEESANVIAQDFEALVKSGTEPSNAMKVRVGTALKKMLVMVDTYKELAK